MTETIQATGTAPFVVDRTIVDGVPAVSADLPVDPTLTLTFGVGYMDATPATAGITHLIEHLVMRRVGYVAVTNNAESGLRTTSFYAVGPADERVDFVRRVCDAVTWLGRITDADLELERQTILSEIGRAGIYPAPDVLSTRFGLAGTGLAAVSHARLLDWTAAEVREVAAHWFHRGNAHLVSTTPLPGGLSLPLPDGTPVPRTPHPEPLLQGRSWTESNGDGLILSGIAGASLDETTRTVANAVVTRVLHESLRTLSGQVYSVDPLMVSVGATTDLWAFALDPDARSVCDVLVAALDVLERLGTTGPTTEELDRARATLLFGLDLSSTRAGWLDDYASSALRGVEVHTVEQAHAVTRDVTTEDVRRLAAELTDSLLVTFPQGHVPHEGASARLESFGATPVDLFPDPEGRTGWSLARALVLDSDRGTTLSVLTGGNRFHGGKPFSGARKVKVVLLPDRFVVQFPDSLWTVPYADVALVGHDADGDVEIVTHRGGVLHLDPRSFWGLAKKFDAMLERLPAAVRYRKDGTRADAEPVDAEPVDGR